MIPDDVIETLVRDVIAEDVAVNTVQQQGAASSYAEAGRLCHLEKPVGNWPITSAVASRRESVG